MSHPRRSGLPCLSLLLAGLCVAGSLSAAPTLSYYRSPTSTSPYSPVVRMGDVVYVSGQVGLGADGKPLADFEAQVHKAMDNVAARLKEAGSDLSQVGHCTALITDAAHWASFNRIYAGYFKPERLPARTAAVVAGLPLGAAVEVECTAAVGG